MRYELFFSFRARTGLRSGNFFIEKLAWWPDSRERICDMAGCAQTNVSLDLGLESSGKEPYTHFYA